MTEIDELRQEYAAGKLDKIKEDLAAFIKKDGAKIKKASQERNASLDLGLRLYILLNKTVNPATDNKDQIEEIRRELWYRHEENPHLEDGKIVSAWTKNHAAGWRDHRVLQIIYVYLQDKEKYLALLG